MSSEQEVRAALSAVDAGDWVAALPDGLDTAVVSQGRITELGSHAELVAAGGVHSALGLLARRRPTRRNSHGLIDHMRD